VEAKSHGIKLELVCVGLNLNTGDAISLEKKSQSPESELHAL